MGNDIVKRTIANLDKNIGNYGFSNNYGLSSAQFNQMVQDGVINTNTLTQNNLGNQNNDVLVNPNYTVNKGIAERTKGTSTFMVTINAVRTGTGSGNGTDIIQLFGSEAYTNAATPYNVVGRNSQTVANVLYSNKNAVRFTYGGGGNTTAYNVSLGTAGEYPFILNSLSGKNRKRVVGIQIEISDAAQISQLSNGIQTFELDEFGKSTINDLTTPRDLYQQVDTGIFIPHDFFISGREGIQMNVNNVDAFQVKMYFYVLPAAPLK